MNRNELQALIHEKGSYLCIGLDTDLDRIPRHLLKYENPIWEFNKAIIDATRDLCVAYKPNTAFYEAYGAMGWEALKRTAEYIGSSHFRIADAKRGDIGNTSRLYAKAFFESMDYDAVTVAPYMGSDSVAPFLGFAEKWVILLALTSNEGSRDFQTTPSPTLPLYQNVITTARTWATADSMMFVVGATHPAHFAEIRNLAPEHFFLVPGIGAQGGDLAAVTAAGKNEHTGLLVNSSRDIIFASAGEDFAEAARAKALTLRNQMKGIAH